jgi:hypothetical protein
MEENIADKRGLWNTWNKDWGFLKHAKLGVKSRTIDEDLIERLLFFAIHGFRLYPKQ